MHNITNSRSTNSLKIRFSRVVCDGKVRFIPQDTNTLVPQRSLSVYEVYLSEKHSSHNSVYDAMQPLNYLFTWAKQVAIDLDVILFQGEMLTPAQVNAFTAWLKYRDKISGERISRGGYNNILLRCSQAFQWFADLYVSLDCRPSQREIHVKIYKDAIFQRFKSKYVKVRKKKFSDDLSDQEIASIEQFLKPENRIKLAPRTSQSVAIRDYLFWRLVIEFGLREGEILALRLEDCPHRGQRNINIVRVEERGDTYLDPRGTYAPRPKTLSRELGFILANSPIPKLISDYTTKHRRRRVKKHGRFVYQPVLDTPAFLILSHHHDSGDPLSISAIQKLAKTIRKSTGIEKFRWHIGRHSFFNRAYGSIVDLREQHKETYKDRLSDLVYWGGWADEKSLQLYVNRARRERAQTTLRFYQEGSSEWKALQ